MKKLILILFLFVFVFKAKAQKADQFNSWWYYSGKYKISKKLEIQTLYSWSRNDFVENWQHSKLKLGTNYNLLKNFKVGGGYEWIVLFPYGAHPVPQKRTEHRITQQFEISTKLKNVSVKFGGLQEQRFIEGNITHRTRIILAVKTPIISTENGKTKLGLSFYNQVFLNVGKKANGNYFNQNRIYGGFDFPINNSLTLSLGYMNQYLIINTNKIENNHTLMVGLFHKLSFVKNK
jgi:hypothetical protein